MHQDLGAPRNQWIHSGHGFIGFFDELDHPKGTHPVCMYVLRSKLFSFLFRGKRAKIRRKPKRQPVQKPFSASHFVVLKPRIARLATIISSFKLHSKSYHLFTYLSSWIIWLHCLEKNADKSSDLYHLQWITNACRGNNRQNSEERMRRFLQISPTIPSNSIPPCLLHDWRKIKSHWSLKPVIQVGGWLNFFLAIYDVILFQKRRHNIIN